MPRFNSILIPEYLYVLGLEGNIRNQCKVILIGKSGNWGASFYK